MVKRQVLLAVGRYAGAAALVTLGFCMREMLQPGFRGDHAYTTFYPVVLLSAYFLGTRPAAFAAAASAGLAYWFFAHPILQWKFDLEALAPLAFFAVSSSVAIYFITGMGRALRDLAVAQKQSETLADSHATLFRELNERVTNHLQLVGAILQLQARDERDVAVSRALAEASARTLLISRAHRSLDVGDGLLLDFESFARKLLDNTFLGRGEAAFRIDLDAGGVSLPPEQATSVAIVLLECLNARLDAGNRASLRISLRGDDKEIRLSVFEGDDGEGPKSTSLIRPVFIEAMVEQLCGQFTERSDVNGTISELIFPRFSQVSPRPVLAALAGTLH